MLKVVFTKQFDKSMALYKKRGKKLEKAENYVELLRLQKPLPERCKDHLLIGNYKGMRELKIEPDWLLIYRIENDVLYLIDTGTHSDLF